MASEVPQHTFLTEQNRIHFGFPPSLPDLNYWNRIQAAFPGQRWVQSLRLSLKQRMGYMRKPICSILGTFAVDDFRQGAPPLTGRSDLFM